MCVPNVPSKSSCLPFSSGTPEEKGTGDEVAKTDVD